MFETGAGDEQEHGVDAAQVEWAVEIPDQLLGGQVVARAPDQGTELRAALVELVDEEAADVSGGAGDQ
ncbi:hypothetical protein PWY87_07640 [Kribbella solani]|nr:hypothetical protein [Kribbella solani]MDX3001534.1 hypothetical protein [Kribbella solani]